LANHGAASCPHPSSSKPRHGAVPATRSVSSIGSTHRPLPSSPRPTALRGGPPLPRVVDRRPPPPLRGVVGQPAFVTSFSTERRSQAASAPALGGGPAPFLFNPDVALSFSSTRRIRQLHLTSTRPRDSCFGAAWAPRTPFNRRMVRRNVPSPPPEQRDSSPSAGPGSPGRRPSDASAGGQWVATPALSLPWLFSFLLVGVCRGPGEENREQREARERGTSSCQRGGSYDISSHLLRRARWRPLPRHARRGGTPPRRPAARRTLVSPRAAV
jgi:hypothetical protein